MPVSKKGVKEIMSKKKGSKPKPSDLGSGAAAGAAKKLQGRAAQIEQAVNPKPKKKKKDKK